MLGADDGVEVGAMIKDTTGELDQVMSTDALSEILRRTQKNYKLTRCLHRLYCKLYLVSRQDKKKSGK